MKCIEVDSVKEIPIIEDKNKKYFVCIGGQKNYQCFCAEKRLSRGEFMNKYCDYLDECLRPIYEDEEIIIRQDAKIALPGFYIVAPKVRYEKILEMPLELYSKCMKYAFIIREQLKKIKDNCKVYIYHDEHYLKPASAHFWVMPIYDNKEAVSQMNLTIFDNDIWGYQDYFKYSENREDILSLNEKTRDLMLSMKG